MNNEQYTQPEAPTPPDNEQDRIYRHAKYLLDGGFIKGVTLEVLIKSLTKPEDRKNIPEAGQMDTFGDLE